MRRLVLICASAVLAWTAAAARAEDRIRTALPPVCPSDNEYARSAVLRFLISPNTASYRQEFGMTAIDTSQVQLLTDSTDVAVCQHLVDNVELPPDIPRVWAFYKAGSFYFVASDNISTTIVAKDPLLIFNSTLTFLGSFGM